MTVLGRDSGSWASCSMNGSIRQRSAGSWELRAYVGVDPATGRRLDRSITVRGNRGDAQRELAEVVARIRCVRAVGSRSTMSELFEAWFATAVDGWSPSTVRQNRSVLDCYLHRHIGSVVVGDVTPALIDALYVRLRRGDNDAHPLAAATVARIHVVMSSAFSQAMRWGWVWDNPASRAHRIVVPANEMRPPTPAELKSLLEFVAPRDRQLGLFLTLAAVTGARRAQLLGLRVAQHQPRRAADLIPCRLGRGTRRARSTGMRAQCPGRTSRHRRRSGTS